MRRGEDAGGTEGHGDARSGGAQPQFLESRIMIQITPQMRVVVAVEPADFRKGIDGLARVCKEVLQHDPFAGWVFVFRNRPATAVKLLVYDGQGFWLCTSGFPAGGFAGGRRRRRRRPRRWRRHQLHVLLSAGNPEAVQAAPAWRPVGPAD